MLLTEFTGLLLNAWSDFRSPRDRDDLGNTDWGVEGERRLCSPELGEDALTTESGLEVSAFSSTQGGLQGREFEILEATTVTSLITHMELRDHQILISLEMQLRIFHEITIQWPLHCRNTINLKLIKGN